MANININYGKKPDVPKPPTVKTTETFKDVLERNAPDAIATLGGEETDKKIVDAIMWNHDQYEKGASDISQKRAKVVRMYNNDYGFDSTGRQNWQSQRNFPQMRVTANKLASRIMRIFTVSKHDWFDIYSYNTALAPLYPLFKKRTAKSLDHPNTKLLKAVRGAILNGLIYSMAAVKVGWMVDDMPAYALEPEPEVPDFLKSTVLEEEKTEYISRSYPVLKNVNPDCVFLDPTGRDRSKIYVYYLTKGEYRDLAESSGWLYTEEVIKTASSRNSETAKMTASRQVGDNAVLKLDSIKVVELFGDLYDEEGLKLQKDIYGVVVNDKYLAYLNHNPYPHGEISLLTCSMENDPQAVYTESSLSAAADSLEIWVKFLNLAIDYYHSRILPMFERDTTNIENPDEVRSFYPGMTIDKSRPEPAMMPVNLGDLPQGAWQFFQLLVAEKKEDTGLQELDMVKQGQAAASAVVRGMSEGSAVFDDMFKQLEESFFAPLLRQTFANMLYYTPDDEWNSWMDQEISMEIQNQLDKIPPEMIAQMKQQMGEDAAYEQINQKIQNHKTVKLYASLKNMSGQERMDKFGKHFQFKTDVLSAFFDRQTFLENLNYYIAMVSKNPLLIAKTNWDYFLRGAVKTMGFDEQRAIINDDKAYRILTIMQKLGIIDMPNEKQEGGEEMTGTGMPAQAMGPGQPNAASQGQMGGLEGAAAPQI